jgi:hypothetical protein
VFKASVQDGALTTGLAGWQEFARSLTAFASTLQNFDANGYGGRVLGGFGEQTLQTAPLQGVGPLVGRTSAQVVGSRPRPLPPGTRTPFRPDATCRDQAPVDLTARTEPLLAPTRKAPR